MDNIGAELALIQRIECSQAKDGIKQMAASLWLGWGTEDDSNRAKEPGTFSKNPNNVMFLK